MDRAEQWALGQGCPVIRLWSSAARADAHRFYEGMGYTNVKTQYSFANRFRRPAENGWPHS